MHKHVRKISLALAIVMVLSVVLSLIAPLVSADDSVSSQLAQAQAQLDKLQDEKKEIEAELSAIEGNKDSVQSQINALDKQIANISAQIKTTEEIIATLDADIIVQEQLLDDATAKMQEQYEALKTRIRVMYEAGQTSYIDILIASENFFDLLSRAEISKQIIDYDNNLFDEYTKNAAIVEAAKLALEENLANQETLKADLDSQKKELETAVKANEAKMKQLMEDEKKAEAAYKDLQSSEEDMNKVVSNLASQLAGSGTYVGGELLWPTPGYTRISSVFGGRVHPITGSWSNHTGIDIAASGGTKILAANSGNVIVSDYHYIYGNYVMVDHGGGTVTLYAHMQSRSVSKGDAVAKGQTLGLVGTTGWSTGNHLHFEVIKSGTHVDPMNYFS